MKKLALLLIAGTMAMSAGAQERHASVVFNRTTENVTAKKGATLTQSPLAKHLSGERTTSGPGGGRWYDYVDSILINDSSPFITGVTAVSGTLLNLWNDTTDVVGYTNAGSPTYYINTWTSLGLSMDPFYANYNDSTIFPHEIMISSTDAYVIDSVAVAGSYLRPLVAGTYTDQMRISLVYGDATSTSDLPAYYFGDAGSTANFPDPQYGIDTLNFIDLLHDSTNNQAGVTAAPGSIQSFTFNLTSADTATNFFKSYPVHLAVTAGNFAAASIGFKSGDPSYAAFDTVQYADGTMKHGQFMPLVVFAADGSGNPTYPPYNEADQTNGYFKREGSQDGGWGGNYIPNWAWSDATTGGASGLQYPAVAFHVTCTTCALTSAFPPTAVSTINNITSINAYPNPAVNEVTIAFNLAATSEVSVTLTDMVGQVVATQSIGSIRNGKAVMNTSTLPSGVYFYTVTANGARSTGRVAIAH